MVVKVKDFVEVCTEKLTGFGEVAWMGIIPEKSRDEPMVGLKMASFQEKKLKTSDGVAHGKKYFSVRPGHGVFAFRAQVSKLNKHPIVDLKLLAEMVLPPPMNITEVANVLKTTKAVVGVMGYMSSSFVDATLLCMFGFRTEYDYMICRRFLTTHKSCLELQGHLRTIVRKIRTDLSVPMQDAINLRKVLDRYDGPKTWFGKERDPCELVDKVFETLLKQPPFLEMSVSLPNGKDKPAGDRHFFYIKSAPLLEFRVPPLQDLFDATVHHSKAFLDEIPKHIIIAIPEAEYKKHGGAIQPSFELDITNVLRAHPKQCGMCGTLAMYQCRGCYLKFGNNLNTTYFCRNCHAQCHEGLEIKHSFRRVTTNSGFQGNFSSRVVMELCALLCRKGTEYVSYVKCDQHPEYRQHVGGEWLFFDSMPPYDDRGLRTPKMEPCDFSGMTDSAPIYHLEMLKALDSKSGPQVGHPTNFFQKGYLAFYNNPKFIYF